MGAPVIASVYIGHGSGDAAFRHYGVRFAEQRFADNAYGGSLIERLDSGSEAGSARADDENIVFVSFVFFVQKSLRSRMVPIAVNMTYRSVKATKNRLVQAINM